MPGPFNSFVMPPGGVNMTTMVRLPGMNLSAGADKGNETLNCHGTRSGSQPPACLGCEPGTSTCSSGEQTGSGMAAADPRPHCARLGIFDLATGILALVIDRGMGNDWPKKRCLARGSALVLLTCQRAIELLVRRSAPEISCKETWNICKPSPYHGWKLIRHHLDLL